MQHWAGSRMTECYRCRWRGSALLALALCLLSLVRLAAAKHPVPMVNVTPFEATALNIPTCCPNSPTQYCLFYFNGYDRVIPTFHLNDGYSGDHALSPVMASFFHWKGSLLNFSPGIKDSITGSLVNVDGSNKNGTFLQCPSMLPPWINPGNQFYVASGGGDVGKLWARAWQRAKPNQHGLKFYRGRCILLPLTGLFFAQKDGHVVQLNVGDGNKDYPENKRCVVFKTSV